MDSSTAPSLRVRLLAAAIPIVLLLALGASAELYLRWREWHRTTPPAIMPLLFYRHTRLRPLPEHDATYFGWVHIDSSGLRGQPVAEQAPPGVLRLMADGGSTTFDNQVSADDSTWPAHLRDLLARRHVADSVEVLNAGVPSYRVIDNLIRLQTDLYRFHPDVIIQMQGHNDLFDALVNRRAPHLTTTPNEEEPISGVRYWLMRHSMLYGKLAGIWATVTAPMKGASDESHATLSPAVRLDRGVEQFRRDLTSYVLIARGMNIKVVLVEPLHVGAATPDAPLSAADSASLSNAFPSVPLSVVRQGYERYADVMRQVAATTGSVFISTEQWGLDSTALYAKGDPMHLTDAGSRRLAEHIAPVLDSLGVLRAAAPP